MVVVPSVRSKPLPLLRLFKKGNWGSGGQRLKINNKATTNYTCSPF
jgi:hypothetical protein